MNILEFQQASKRTAPFNANATNEQELNWFLSNYTLGLVGESIELCQILDNHEKFCKLDCFEQKEMFSEFIKECGDVWHYIVNLMSVLGEKFDYDKLQDAALEDKLHYLTGYFAENIKKGIYHGHGIDKENLIAILYQISFNMLDISAEYLEEILNTNIRKLKKRYPEKFTTEDSIARVDTK